MVRLGRRNLDCEVSCSRIWTGYLHNILGKGINTNFPCSPRRVGYLKTDSDRYCQNASYEHLTGSQTVMLPRRLLLLLTLLSLFLGSWNRIKYGCDSWSFRVIMSVKALWAHMWKTLYKYRRRRRIENYNIEAVMEWKDIRLPRLY